MFRFCFFVFFCVFLFVVVVVVVVEESFNWEEKSEPLKKLSG